MPNTFETLSNDIASTVAAVSPHVVRVEARRRLPASGVVLGDGLIATSHHVVKKENDIKIGLENGESTTASLVGRDPSTDLAILRTEATLAKAPMADTPGSVGSLVLALGRPGHSIRASFGIIAAMGEPWQTSMGGVIDHYIENDLVMYPGFSGGPLVNAAGQIVGINTSALIRGVSTTISASTVQRISSMIVEHGGVRRGYLGVNTQAVALPAALAEQLKQAHGLLLISVEPDSPAQRAGLALGDTIVSFRGKAIRSHDDLLAQLSSIDNASQPLTYIRGGEAIEVDVEVAFR